MAAAKYRCFACLKNVAATTDDHYRKHDREKGSECTRSKRDIPTWLLRRGPETGPDDDVPVKGRDYADCSECSASPALDGATGHLTDHLRQGETPTSKRVPCPGSGQPCKSGEGECESAPPSPKDQPDTDVPLGTLAGERPATAGPTEAEEMLSKWARAAREIEDRKLPPCPESTTTPPDSPPPGSEPVSASKKTNAPTDGSSESAPSAAATEAPTSPTLSNGTGKPEPTPCHITAPHPPHQWMLRRKATQCPGKPVPQTASTAPAPAPNSAEGAAAASEAAPSSTKSSEAPSDAESTPTALTPAEPAPAPVESPATDAAREDARPPDIEALATAFPKRPPVSAASPAAASRNASASTTQEPASNAAASSPEKPLFAQPGSPFSQPGAIQPAAAAVPMSLEGERIAAGLKQLFFDYCNRTERSRQKTLGPSGIGTPCDRKIAMTLLDIPAVNPGWIDKWASFVGTCIHGGLAEVFEWANAGTGRYATEMPLTFPSPSVPKGTGDLLDRTYASFLDHKSLSAYGVKKFQEEGPPPHHRIQVQVYAYGARLRGEVVDHVVIIGWPREGNSLNDLCVWTERYDPQIARDALARVDGIADAIATYQARNKYMGALDAARQFPVADDCKFCNWYAPGDPDMARGCPGR